MIARHVAAFVLAASLAAPALSRTAPAPRWIASWGSAQMIPEGENILPAERARAVTLRQVVRLSAGGDRLRIRVSNVFGTAPLRIGAASVARAARPGTPRIAGGTHLAFAGRPLAVIPAGAEIYSDPVTMPVAAGTDLAVDLHLPDAATPQTGHPGARATSFTLSGDHVGDPLLAGATPTTRWYALSDIEVAGPQASGTVVAIGDSITDGYGVAPETNMRWTDRLAERLRGQGIGVVNAGIGGNRMLRDGLGPNLVARFDRDVIARSGVRWAVLLAGVNDLGVLTRDAPATPAAHADIVAQLTAAYRQVAARAHAHGIRIIGATIMPFGGNEYYRPGPATEADRQAVNAFIRNSGTFDAVIDFDRIMRDPARPDRLAPGFDSGDHLHPSPAGYRAMGDAVPLALFAGPAADPRPAIALTFDDLPAHGPLAPGQTRLDVARLLVRALTDAKAPAFGFMNAGFGKDDPAMADKVLAAWHAAGFPIGNHGFAHVDLEQVGTAAFTADILRNEAPLARAARGGDWRWFRYPFLSEGSTAALRDPVRAELATHGYRIAAVTMGFDDYKWNGPYVACVARRDAVAIARLERGVLDDARTAALAARARARAQFGRDIPYVLLMHAGAFDAHIMPRLLALYRELGFRFVTLAEAQADPFYAAAMDPALPGPSPSLAGPPATPALAGPPAGLCQ